MYIANDKPSEARKKPAITVVVAEIRSKRPEQEYSRVVIFDLIFLSLQRVETRRTEKEKKRWSKRGPRFTSLFSLRLFHDVRTTPW